MESPEPSLPNAARPPGGGRRRATGLIVAGAALGMVGLAFAAVPLYQLFCQVTGYGGTTQTAQTAPDRVLERTVRVQFDANIAGSLPWHFAPEQRSVVAQLGQPMEIAYRAESLADGPTAGTAVFNVAPAEVGAYFTKIDCFCFSEQQLAAGEAVSMPVLFYVDPALDEDPILDYIDTITLSYTFYPARATVAQNGGRDGG